jgi:hypothetical protein
VAETVCDGSARSVSFCICYPRALRFFVFAERVILSPLLGASAAVVVSNARGGMGYAHPLREQPTGFNPECGYDATISDAFNLDQA